MLCTQTSLGGLRQEVHAVKQLSSSRSGSSPQQHQQQHQQQHLGGLSYHHGAAPGDLLADPLPGFTARLSTPMRRNTLGYSETSGVCVVLWSQQGGCVCCTAASNLVHLLHAQHPTN